MELTDLSDVALLESLAAVCGEGHRVTARVVAHLAEVEERRLHLNAACTSLFDFCVRKLGMSEGAAFRRINAARLVRRFPRLLSRIESGAIHLCTLVLVRDVLTEETFDTVLDEVAGKTQRDVAAVVARLAPKPDVEERMTRLPDVRAQTTLADPSLGDAASAAAASIPRSKIAPLSEERYQVQLTASASLRDKLERARDLLRHEHPSGDLATVIEEALDTLIDRLEKRKLGKAQRPRRESRPAKPGRIRTSTRREVYARDGEQCTFVSERGERCPGRSLLELDHVVPRACGGGSEASNLRVRCRAHNRLYAEEVFGRAHVARAIDFRQRSSLITSLCEADLVAGFKDKEVAVATTEHEPARRSVVLDVTAQASHRGPRVAHFGCSTEWQLGLLAEEPQLNLADDRECRRVRGRARKAAHS